MPAFLQELPTMIGTSDLINVSAFGTRRVNFNPQRGDVCFYCLDCHTFVPVRRLDPVEAKKAKHHARQHAYACEKCRGFNVALGTQEGLREFYEIKPHHVPPVPSVVNLPPEDGQDPFAREAA